MRELVLVSQVILSACVEASAEGPEHRGEDCTVESVVDESASMVDDILDCGHVGLEDALEDWQAAQACAADALGRGVPMRLVYQATSLDSSSVNALLRESEDDDVRFYYYTWVLDEGGWVLSYGCPEVVSSQGCNVAVGQICLECTEGSPEVKECIE